MPEFAYVVMEKCSKVFDTDMKLAIDVMIANIRSQGVRHDEFVSTKHGHIVSHSILSHHSRPPA